VTELLLDRARTGDEQAFADLTAPFQRELHVHCYRILGSLQDAEDALQETLLAAWRGLDGYEQRASLRTWLYRIATNRCLNTLRAGDRRAPMEFSFDSPIPEPTRETEIIWLEPYPDVLLEGLPDSAPGPAARYAARESISLAFVTVLQTLPPRQRAVLILRDVMGFHAAEVAEMLETTEESVTSALKRARAALSRAPELRESPPPPPDSPEERELLRKLTIAYESSDVDALVELLTEDVWMRMPPAPIEYQGRELFKAFMTTVAFRPGREFRVLPTRANGQPAFGLYPRDEATGLFRAYGVLVFTLSVNAVSAITRFDNGTLAQFGLPRILP